MSDRYETPRWDDEPDDLETRTRSRTRGMRPGGAGAEVEEPGLEASSENVLDGWPAVDPDTVPEDEEESPVEEVPAARRPAAEATPVAELTRPPRSQPRPRRPDRDPFPLADRVRFGRACARELTVPPGYSVLEGVPNGERRASASSWRGSTAT
jgi:hypothetical protein